MSPFLCGSLSRTKRGEATDRSKQASIRAPAPHRPFAPSAEPEEQVAAHLTRDSVSDTFSIRALIDMAAPTPYHLIVVLGTLMYMEAITMATSCVACGTDLPDAAAFCWRCGTPQNAAQAQAPAAAPQVTWEYKELVVPLDLTTATLQGWGKHIELATAQAEHLLVAQIKQAARNGWQTEDQPELRSLLQSGRVVYRRGLFRVRWQTATIRLSRLSSEA
jgi:hypothetical protein